MIAIVMYRNPLEEWFWEGGALYICSALLVTICITAIVGGVIDLINKRRRK